jgi:hypothetical protein
VRRYGRFKRPESRQIGAAAELNRRRAPDDFGTPQQPLVIELPDFLDAFHKLAAPFNLRLLVADGRDRGIDIDAFFNRFHTILGLVEKKGSGCGLIPLMNSTGPGVEGVEGILDTCRFIVWEGLVRFCPGKFLRLRSLPCFAEVPPRGFVADGSYASAKWRMEP